MLQRLTNNFTESSATKIKLYSGTALYIQKKEVAVFSATSCIFGQIHRDKLGLRRL